MNKLMAYPRAFTLAIVVHVVFVVFLLMSLDWSTTHKKTKPKVNVVQAVAVDEKKILAEVEKLKQAEAKKQKKAAQTKRQRQKEERRLRDLKKKRKAEEKQLKKEQAKRKQESKRLAEVTRKKAAAEKKRKAEESRLAKLAADRKLAEKKKRQAAEQKRRRAAELALKKKILAEQQRERAARDARTQTIVDQYVELIRQKVTRNWVRPKTSQSSLSCTVMVKMIPSGDVVVARVTRSSGEALFDRSVETAVFQAAPLPIPPDASLFNRFRELEFKFIEPEG